MKIQSEHQAEIDKFKQRFMTFIETATTEWGGFEPAMVILGLIKGTKKYQDFYVGFIGDIFADKDELAGNLRKLVDKLTEDKNCIPVCVSWATECWMRLSDTQKVPKDWQSLPKVEGVMATFETEYSSGIVAWKMYREGKTTNKKGDLIDKIRLERDEKMSSADGVSGRFANLFRKHITNEN